MEETYGYLPFYQVALTWSRLLRRRGAQCGCTARVVTVFQRSTSVRSFHQSVLQYLVNSSCNPSNAFGVLVSVHTETKFEVLEEAKVTCATGNTYNT